MNEREVVVYFDVAFETHKFTVSRAAGTKRRSQVTGHRSQVTENAIKKLETLLGFLCLFICFISGYVTIRHMFGIDYASCCSKSKRTEWRKLHIVLELEELLLSFGCLGRVV